MFCQALSSEEELVREDRCECRYDRPAHRSIIGHGMTRGRDITAVRGFLPNIRGKLAFISISRVLRTRDTMLDEKNLVPKHQVSGDGIHSSWKWLKLSQQAATGNARMIKITANHLPTQFRLVFFSSAFAALAFCLSDPTAISGYDELPFSFHARSAPHAQILFPE